MIDRKNLKSQSRRPGFTLVEMLVAVGLVVLMMLMFAQVFQTAGGLVSNQKGMAELDQGVRTLTILLRGDIKQRTFVDVVPFVADQNTDAAPGYDESTGKGYDAEFRKGFFSISENDPDIPWDDVLHLTIRTDSPLRDKAQLPYSGKTRLLYTGSAPMNPDQYLFNNPDQPESDDGQIAVNNTGSSRYAEVCWFLRNGNLYRRILLIRDPYNRGGNTERPEDPQDNAGNEFIDTFYDPNQDGNPDPSTENFWRDFDYSAYWEPSSGLKFHAAPNALENVFEGGVGVPNLLNLPRSLGIPFLRYGSSVNRADEGPPLRIFGPREYIDSAAQTGFIGRFTVRETADSNFQYPGAYTQASDPFNENGGPDLSLNNDGLVNPYADEIPRRGEDIVLSNVHEFDIQVWDDQLSEFVDLGHNRTVGGTPAGWYHQNQMRLPDGSFSPDGTTDYGNRYDTWHPHDEMPDSPPYAPFDDSNGDREDLDANGLGADGEIWLKAIRIKIRFYDQGSEQMRDLTFTFRLNRENSGE